jgi:hypothetical protein
MSTIDRHEILQLADAAIDGTLDAAQLQRLEQLVLGDKQAAEIYVHYVAMSATLRMTHGNPLDLSPLHVAEEPGVTARSVDSSQSMGLGSSLGMDWKPLAAWSLGCLAVVASLLVLLRPWTGIQLSSSVPSSSVPSSSVPSSSVPSSSVPSSPVPPSLVIAQLVETKGCRWDSGTLPTAAGAQLVAGRLKLAAGLARIVFSSGVEVQLESPAELELVSPMLCRVNSGKLVATVPEGAQGFVVETPTSVVTDFGTEFGVSVGNDASAVVQVFKGRVDTRHRPSGHVAVMTQGDVLHFRPSDFGPYQYSEPAASEESQGASAVLRTDPILISTADSGGRDAFVQAQDIADSDRELGFLLVKRPYPSQAAWERRALLGFELSELGNRPVVEAELRLTLGPTGLGFASRLPDATFFIYGLVDGPRDAWTEEDLKWEDLPPIDYSQQQASAESAVVWLGAFDVPQGKQAGTMTVSTQPLVDFLNADTNQRVTLLVVRKTAGEGESDLVHGFASRRHASLPAPTLRIVVDKN